MEVLQAKNLKKIYGSGNNAVHALDGVDLSVKKGEFVAIVGTSGSGKSTLLHMLGGLDRPTSGTVMVDGQDIFSLKEEALTIFRRRKIGFVFQACLLYTSDIGIVPAIVKGYILACFLAVLVCHIEWLLIADSTDNFQIFFRNQQPFYVTDEDGEETGEDVALDDKMCIRDRS